MPDDSNHSVQTSLFPERNFFGRRKGPRLHSGHQKLVDEFLPQLKLDTDRLCVSNIHEIFKPINIGSIEVEIGFGGGEHLVTRALQNPNIGFIGIEPFVNGMAKALSAIKQYDIKNIRLFDDDAAVLLDSLPPESINKVFLLYPDPWPKRRHWKRRFVNQTNLQRIARVMKHSRQFYFATDIDSYQNWTLQHINLHSDFIWTANCAQDWHQPWQDWTQTRYEAKAVREGRTPGYFIFQRI